MLFDVPCETENLGCGTEGLGKHAIIDRAGPVGRQYTALENGVCTNG